MKKAWFILIISMFVLSGCGKLEGAFNLDVESFSYTNQDGKPFGSDDLKDKVWVADFIFTNCDTVCPPMTANLTKLKKLATEKKLNVEFVSFSADPEVDTPEKLKKFADVYNSSYDNWNLLTGYYVDEAKLFAKKNFKTLIDKPEGQDQVIHGTSFYLLKGDKLMKRYEGVSDVQYEQILKDIKTLN